MDTTNWSSYKRKWNILASQIECDRNYHAPQVYQTLLIKLHLLPFSLDLSRDVCNITSEMEARARWRPSITISPRVDTRGIYRVRPVMRHPMMLLTTDSR